MNLNKIIDQQEPQVSNRLSPGNRNGAQSPNVRAGRKRSKIIFMGNPSVGKTSIINSFVKRASMKSEKLIPTPSIEDFTHVMTVKDSAGNNHELEFSIWDAAGD